MRSDGPAVRFEAFRAEKYDAVGIADCVNVDPHIMVLWPIVKNATIIRRTALAMANRSLQELRLELEKCHPNGCPNLSSVGQPSEST